MQQEKNGYMIWSAEESSDQCVSITWNKVAGG
jgi:hypothetical protein